MTITKLLGWVLAGCLAVNVVSCVQSGVFEISQHAASDRRMQGEMEFISDLQGALLPYIVLTIAAIALIALFKGAVRKLRRR